MPDCPSEDTLVALAGGHLPPERQASVHAHLGICDLCRRTVADLARSPTLGGRSSSDPRGDLPPAPSPAPDLEPLRSGQRLGNYRIVRRIGGGGMGLVYEALNERTAGRAAIKVLHPRFTRDRELVRRFLNEARAPNLIGHESLVKVHDHGQLPDGTDYLVMEYLDGEPMDGLAGRPGYGPALLLRLTQQVADALVSAHEAGIIHRDLKPANVMVVPDRLVPGGLRAKVLDFGLAKLSAALSFDASLTPTQTPLGTPIYMAPEQCRGAAEVDGQADVYSLGIMLYQLLCGHVPFLARNVGEIIAMHLRDAPPPLDRACPGLPQDLVRLVHQMLAKDPPDRPTMAEVAARLGPFIDALGAAPARPRPRLRLPRPVWLAAGLALTAGAGIGIARLIFPPRAGGQPERVYIPGGSFQMGSTALQIGVAIDWCGRQTGKTCTPAQMQREQPARAVVVTSFWIHETEVTNAHYAAWLNRQAEARLWYERQVWRDKVLLADLAPMLGHGGLAYKGGRYQATPGYERKPVTQVTWGGALAYCQSLGMRLPTEAEWEFAARGSGGTTFPWGEDTPSCEGVVFGRSPNMACQHLSYGPDEVGKALQDRSARGVRGLAGNVSEWVMDRFVAPYPGCRAPCVDPRVDDPTLPDTRVVRGGDWYAHAPQCRAAARSHRKQDEASGNIGFRCAIPSSP